MIFDARLLATPHKELRDWPRFILQVVQSVHDYVTMFSSIINKFIKYYQVPRRFYNKDQQFLRHWFQLHQPIAESVVDETAKKMSAAAKLVNNTCAIVAVCKHILADTKIQSAERSIKGLDKLLVSFVERLCLYYNVSFIQKSHAILKKQIISHGEHVWLSARNTPDAVIAHGELLLYCFMLVICINDLHHFTLFYYILNTYFF